MSVRVHERLELTDGMRLEVSHDVDAPARFVPGPHGVTHLSDSLTGKRDGDATLYPWHRVVELTTFRLVYRRA